MLEELVFQSQVKEVTDGILKSRPDFVVITRNPESRPDNINDTRQAILDVVASQMVRVESVGAYDIWALGNRSPQGSAAPNR